MDNHNMDKFFKAFRYEIFPVMRGEDGKGIEKFRAIVEKKRIEVNERKIEKMISNIFSNVSFQITKPSMSYEVSKDDNKQEYEYNVDYSIKINRVFQNETNFHTNFTDSNYHYIVANNREFIGIDNSELPSFKNSTSHKGKEAA